MRLLVYSDVLFFIEIQDTKVELDFINPHTHTNLEIHNLNVDLRNVWI